ncbi:response regulator [Pseudomonas guariconensis]|uniref:hybrid sensor histidine kinase/response regulator n=1 Tax=Pseudomonas guariconensis TaxID=1288410 RepID=UPI0018D78DE4|nr:hybrid sensor histidine kinase/response regulator [Pseudomonas guariconensis]MBH3358182.1 response regulator [Pseudomonas guariconensis]
MKHSNALLDNLTRSSSRLSKGIMVLLGVAVLLVSTTYWSFQRLIEEHHDTVRFHFTRLMQNIQEQELFLTSLRQRSLRGELMPRDAAQMPGVEPRQWEGDGMYRGQENPFSMPFSVRLATHAEDTDKAAQVAVLAAHLSAYYSAFWATSHFQSPQAFLFNRQGDFDVAVPARGEHSTGTGTREPIGQMFDMVRAQAPQGDGPEVKWRAYGSPGNGVVAARVLAYANLDLLPEQLRIKDSGPHATAAVMLDLTHANDFQRTMDWSVYDRFTLVTPSGQVLSGILRPEMTLHEGFNLKSDGLVFKLVNHDGPAWTAIYTIGFKSFFRYALGSLLSLGAGLAGLGGLGWAASRWYRRQVILPANQAHAAIAESEAFSRVVIDTAPTGLCVVRRADRKVLLENQRARQWQGTAALVAALDHWQDSGEGAEHALEIEGRHLQVGFVATRYQGQDVRLYAFNDVTRHVEDARALEDARRTAAAANEAKTLFLATMSHEIRTPLYGVLGTLELLGLTPLAPRQQAYLQTIQRSSATLFQLISDVLDVSKIESGQMALEPVEFCPLEMIEDTLRTYSAFAQRKGLLLYGCTDARLPQRVFGDPIRIRQILNNLLSNAIKFTDSGRVVLRTRVLDCAEGQVHLEWQVADTGIGLSDSQQARLFELFYQVHGGSNEGGAGLGLPICGWLSEMMGGQMKVVSEPGLGSSFTLRLALPVVTDALPSLTEGVPSAMPVFVRAPIPELAQHHCDWLNRLGLRAHLAPSTSAAIPARAVLVDVLPDETAPAWPGPRIRCHATDSAQAGRGDWDMSLHDVQAIARAVCRINQGQMEPAVQRQAGTDNELGLHILVAEDNPINQAILKEQLEALGCSVVVARNGEHALQLWQPEVFDLVLTDVNMPVVNGYELATALREQDPELPIIGVTANAMREEGARCLEVGMNAWIVKPLSLQTLRSQLLKLCRPHWQGDKQEPVVPQAHTTDEQHEDVLAKLSPAMRALFIETMTQDIQALETALEQGDLQALGRQLHSIAGALGAVQATSLAQHCIALEVLLADQAYDEAAHLQVRKVIQRLAAMIDALK